MYTITKEFTWDMAHRLENHKGLCNNVHGHTYKMLVTFRRVGNGLIMKNKNKDGMVEDFKEIKNIIKHYVDMLDHSFMYNAYDTKNLKIANFLSKEINQKLFAFNRRVTAENMTRWFYEKINSQLTKSLLECYSVTIYETPTSYATYCEELK